jgi:signal transduction histidine kinase
MEGKTKKVSNKIIFLVGIQIAIIATSFLILESFESQKIYAGNSVNIAGKNRFLTEKVLNAVKDYYIGGKLTGDPISALAIYEKNLQLLKTGGTQMDTTLSPLPEEFDVQWENIHNLYLDYKTKIQSFVESDLTSYRETKLVEISDLADKLIEQNDILTIQLALEVQNLTTVLIWMQISLAIINIGVHLFMIKMIYNILKKETERLVKMERMYTVGTMASRLAHDLRNPLTVIKNAISLIEMKNPNTDEKTTSNIERLNSAVSRMTQQIDDVTDFVRTRELQLEENSIKDIVNLAIQTTYIPQNIMTNLPQNDVRLKCDKKQLEVLISNLISNAIDAIGENTGTVTVRLGEDPQNVFIEIEDTGPGIPENVLPNIFELLFTTKQKGTGLGLVSCKNIVESHMGKIDVKNNPTRFRVIIPKIMVV